jgi:hypothetical protein
MAAKLCSGRITGRVPLCQSFLELFNLADGKI